MSFDLMVFEKGRAPAGKADFLKRVSGKGYSVIFTMGQRQWR